MSNIKAVFVGDTGSGKTHLISAYLRGTPPDEKKATLFENYFKDVVHGTSSYRLYICDTGGRSDLNRLKHMSYLNTDVFVICADYSKHDSLRGAEKWAVDLKKTGRPVLLCLTKADLDKKIPEGSIEEFLEKHSIYGVYVTTAFGRKSVKSFFEKVIQAAVIRSDSEEGMCSCSLWRCCNC